MAQRKGPSRLFLGVGCMPSLLDGAERLYGPYRANWRVFG